MNSPRTPKTRRLALNELEARDVPAITPVGPEALAASAALTTRQGVVMASDADGNYVAVWAGDRQDGSSYGVYAQRFTAAGAASGQEFRVNSATTNRQIAPAVAMDADGDFVVAWESAGQDGSSYGVYAQRFTAAGTAAGQEFRVNTTTAGAQRSPTVAMDADGDFVVAWQSRQPDGSPYDVYARRYTGAEAGPEYRVNTVTAGTQADPSAAMAADGDFIVAWTSYGQDGGGNGVFARRFGADGLAQGDEFLVNTTTAGAQQSPAVAMTPAGAFVVAWQGDTLAYPSSIDVYTRRFDAAGAAAGAEVRVNTHTHNQQTQPAVAAAADGAFAVAWQSVDQDETFVGVYARRFTAAGAAVSAEARASVSRADFQSAPALTMVGAGDFAVAWRGDASYQFGYGAGEALLRRYAADGVPVGGEARLGADRPAALTSQVVAADPAGNSVVAWVSRGHAADGVGGIYARRYGRDGAPLGPEFRVSQTAGIKNTVSVAVDAAGGFVFAWDNSPEYEFVGGLDVYARRYDAAGAPRGPEVRVNTFTQYAQEAPAVAAESNGDYVVAWQSNVQDGSGTGVYAQRFTAAGAPLGGEVRVNTATTASQGRPAAAMDADGDFVVAWESYGQDGAGSGVFAQRFFKTGARAGGEFRVNVATAGDQSRLSAAMAADGAFVVAWLGADPADSRRPGVYVRRYSHLGVAQGGEARVETAPALASARPAVAMDPAGDFVVAWQDYGPAAAGGGLYARQYAANGTPNGAGGRLTTAAPFAVPAVALNADGDAVVAWQGYGENQAGSGTRVQRFAATWAPTLTGVFPGPFDVDPLRPFTFTAAGRDADAEDTLTFSLAGAPEGAAIDPATGAFAWTPAVAQADQTFSFDVRLSDGTHTTVAPVTVRVRPENRPPALSDVPAAGFAARTFPYIFRASATDPDTSGQMVRFSLVGAPAGAGIGPYTGEFSWTPGADTPAGDYTFQIVATDNGVPALSAAATTTVTVGHVGHVGDTIYVSGTPGPDTIVVTSRGGVGRVTVNGVAAGPFRYEDFQVFTLLVDGLAGNDRITAVGGLEARLAGGDGNDTLTGDGYNDILEGGAGNDVLAGGGGTDYLDGGAGNDVLNGGADADGYAFTGDWGRDRVADAGGAGDRMEFGTAAAVTFTSTVRLTPVGRSFGGGISYARTPAVTAVSGANAVTGATGIEEVLGGGGDDTLTGGDAGATFDLFDYAAVRVGPTAFRGVEAIIGGRGADTLKFTGGIFFGRFDGGGGTNTVDCSALGDGVNIDLAAGTAGDALRLANVDVVVGGAGGDTLTAAAGGSRLVAGGGDFNELIGGPGPDTLVGGAGIDMLHGNGGDDVLSGGRGDDTFWFADGWGRDALTDAGGSDQFDFSATTTGVLFTKSGAGPVTAVGGANRVAAAGMELVTGGAGADTLTGGDAPTVFRLTYAGSVYGDPTLGGVRFAGVDALLGGAGADTFKPEGLSFAGPFDGGGGRNTLDFSGGDGVNVNLAAGESSYLDGVARVYRVLGGAGGNWIVGDDQANVLTGPGTLDGGAGDDTLTGGNRLIGGAGDDRLTGGPDTDTYVFGDDWGRDTVVATAGADQADFTAVTAGVAFRRTNLRTLTAASGPNAVALRDIEYVAGGAGADTLTGTAGANLFQLTETDGGEVGPRAADLAPPGFGGPGVMRFVGVENLAGGAGGDRLRIGDWSGLTGAFAGGGGRDLLDYSLSNGGVTVNLALGTAPRLGGFSGVTDVSGGDGDDVLVGDGRANVLDGVYGPDILIGGGGADTLTAENYGGLLIAGRTAFDADPAALAAIRQAWGQGTTADPPYAARVADITAGTGLPPGVKLDATTVFDDDAPDRVTGSVLGGDWFFSSPGDVLTNWAAGDEVNTVV